MKILIAHNRYQQFGGEDQVVAAEAGMLSRNGHRVEHLSFDNEGIQGGPAKVGAALSSFFSLSSYDRALKVLEGFGPDVLHVHNFIPNLSPSIFFASKRARVPVVQTLHNYRLICANALLYRDGSVCEECVQADSFLPGVRHGCYRGSRVGSAIVGANMALHSSLGTWVQRINRYIVLTEFAAQKLSLRVPPSLIRVKPNFVPDRGAGEANGDFLLYVGRLSQEKGLETLIAADKLGPLPLPVVIVGDGPLRGTLEEACARPGTRLRMIGRQSGDEVLLWMKRAAALLLPSTCYEGFPMTIAEALSVGLPVIASRTGGIPEIVPDCLCGLLHTPGDPKALVSTVEEFSRMVPETLSAMRVAARNRYLEKYSEVRNHVELIRIYEEAISTHVPGAVNDAALSTHAVVEA